MKRKLLAGVCAALIAVGLSIGTGAQVPGFEIPSGVGADESTDLWFVELASPPAADGTSLAIVRSEKAAFRRAAAAAGLRYQERYAFDTLWNGLSVRVARGEMGKLSRIDGVKAVYPVAVVEAPAAPSAESGIDLATAVAMTGADVAQNELGLSGRGVKVAIVDTGIDYDHQDLGGCFGVGCRVGAGYDFVGDAFNADPASPTFNLTAVPDVDPDDCAGHGSHVSGIVGANGAVKGVAPGVSFGAYRVFGCQGSTLSDIMIAAMERALADGMDVLNMSIGSSFQWPQYPTAQAATRLVNKKVIVVASIGNSGANGLYSASAPGVGEKVIGVASFENTHVRLPYFTVTPDDTPIGYSQATAAPAAPTSGSSDMARTGTATSAADACTALPAGSLTGKVALIRRGTCGFHVKALNAQVAGAAGVVLYNNAPGRLNATVAGAPAITIPVVSISDTEGVLINNRLAAGAVTMTWTDQVMSFAGGATAGLISSFSSYGLSPDLTLKPDLAAPGGAIYSTYPLEYGGYATLSGTSMAAPHVAGAVALLLEAEPNMSHQGVRAILQNSANPKLWFGNPALGFLEQVQRQGAGMLDIPGSILATTRVEPAKLSLGESEAGPATRTLSITNRGAEAVTYTLSHTPALSGNNTFAPAFFSNFATVAFSTPSIVVPAGATVTVDATITAPTGPTRGQYGGYIVFTPSSAGPAYRVPYAGFVGDYQSIRVLAPTANGFPWLAQLSGASYFNRSSGATYTMAGTDVPFFLVHLDHQSRRLRMEVSDATTGKSWFRALDEEYVGRNATAGGFFALDWDGTTTSGTRKYTVPNGQYVVKISVLKALGDPTNPSHWEIWTSPIITIARP